MIVSVSRRTDIPAFYLEWFFNRLKEGYVLARNPMNYNQVSKISLRKEDIDCFVFWTKDPKKILDKVHLLQDYNFYFQITLTPYDKDIEVGLPKKDEIINSFITLSKKIGAKKVNWRYDPILLSEKINHEYHFKNFEYIASKLSGFTNTCTVSFLDEYTKTKRNTRELLLKKIHEEDMIEIAKGLSKIASRYNVKISSCCEKTDLSDYGIDHGKCIDGQVISQIIGRQLSVKKDKNQREECGCVESVDIGAYNTCPHLCKYCYANYSSKTALKNHKLHKPNSPLLFGELTGNEIIRERKTKKDSKGVQLSLLE